uniref:Uncharacterized protein n=1 Tax=Zea mays TaxID=4577 RepID=A0A804LHX0_MAIZE
MLDDLFSRESPPPDPGTRRLPLFRLFLENFHFSSTYNSMDRWMRFAGLGSLRWVASEEKECAGQRERERGEV